MLKFIESTEGLRGVSTGYLCRVALRAVVVAAMVGTGAVGATAQSLATPTPAYSSSADRGSEAMVVAPLPDFRKMMVGAGGGAAPQNDRRGRDTGYYRGGEEWSKFTVYVGGGSTVPLANTAKYLTPNFDIQAGVGYRFGRHFELPVEFDWDQFGVTKSSLDNQIGIYDSLFANNSVKYLLDGNSHIWSFSLQPTYTFYAGPRMGAYVKAGVGFYHKVANFTLPSARFDCYYYCGIYEANYNLDHYTSNAPGYDAGFGLTYKFSPDSRARFYAEARYVFIDNDQRYGITNTTASLATVTDSTTNFYPANSNRTENIPITVGVRF